MDRVTSPGSPIPAAGQVEAGAELLQDIGADRKENYEYPSRSTSRLGFNKPIQPACSPIAPSESDTAQVSAKTLQGGSMSSSPSALSKNAPAGQDNAPMHSALATEASPSGKIDGALKCASSPNATATVHGERPTMRKTPSVSRLSFPFKTTSQRRAAQAPTPPPSPPPRPPPRHKYSCHPTLLSPMVAGRPYPKQHKRHQYGQHGHSRTGLQHAKWFWATREQEYGHVSAHAVSSLAYGAIVIDDFSMPRQHGPSINDVAGKPPPLSPPIMSNVSELGSTVPPLTIHPRRGDIASLRDPYSAHVDRCFAGMPAWTISKTLWMHDLELAMDKEPPTAQTPDESDTESDLETVGSFYSSDDSDTTLIESENESEYVAPPKLTTSASKFRDNHAPKNVHRAHTHTLYAGPSSLTVAPPFKHHSSTSIPSPLEIYNTSWALSKAATPTSKSHIRDGYTRPTRTTKASWPTNWYRRWEVLAHLCHQDRSQAQALITISSTAMEASLLSPRTTFYQRSMSSSSRDAEDGE